MPVIKITKQVIENSVEAREAALKKDPNFRASDGGLERQKKEAQEAKLAAKEKTKKEEEKRAVEELEERRRRKAEKQAIKGAKLAKKREVEKAKARAEQTKREKEETMKMEPAATQEHGKEVIKIAKDPVCGMEVDEKSAPAKYTEDGGHEMAGHGGHRM